MKELIRNKEEINNVLRTMLIEHEKYKELFKKSPEESIEKTLKSYDDFYEWLTKKEWTQWKNKE